MQFKELLKSDAPIEVKDIVKYSMKNSPSSFEEILKKNANLFENWRYYYEANDGVPISCDEWFLYEFCTGLHNIMGKIMESL